MADPKPTSERLTALRARWESDKGSRVFLQLADEYRRLGREEDAVLVLDEGLKVNPGHVGARVARGRSLLALGRAREATADLEKVIEADPTQMVAYRFLVEGYIQQRDADQARQRLSVYGLLNDSDPDIEELDRKIRELERAERTGAWPMPNAEKASGATGTAAESASPPPAVAPEPGAGASEEPFPAAPPGAPDVAPEAPLGDLSTPEEEPFAAPPVAPPQRATEAIDPFPSLTIPEDRRRYLQGFDDDLFGSSAAPVQEEAVEVEEIEPAIELAGTVEEAAPPEAPDEPFDLAAPPKAEAADLGALLAPEEEAQEAEEVDEPQPSVAPEEPAPEPEPAPAAEPAPEQGRATVTLGRLYLRQGHLAEAEESFREVLARDPDNAEALQGLEEVAALRAPGLDASELLGGYDPSRDGEGLTARKRYALRQYLERLRGGAADVH